MLLHKLALVISTEVMKCGHDISLCTYNFLLMDISVLLWLKIKVDFPFLLCLHRKSLLFSHLHFQCIHLGLHIIICFASAAGQYAMPIWKRNTKKSEWVVANNES